MRFRRTRNDKYDSNKPGLRYSADRDVYSHQPTSTEYLPRHSPLNFDEYIDPRDIADETVRSC